MKTALFIEAQCVLIARQAFQREGNAPAPRQALQQIGADAFTGLPKIDI